jgi:hypothetical protein
VAQRCVGHEVGGVVQVPVLPRAARFLWKTTHTPANPEFGAKASLPYLHPFRNDQLLRTELDRVVRDCA